IFSERMRMKLLTHYLNEQSKNQHSIINWRENSINDLLFYSFRSTDYNRHTCPSTLHYHDYYELVIFIEGKIQYLCESEVYAPQYGDIILVPPGKLHMSMLTGDQTRYTRHVFYLYPSALDELGCGVLTSFIKTCSDGVMLTSMAHHARNEARWRGMGQRSFK
ncbi:MAG: AraC family ligand binding domain-containing protein, partial [Proteobacteria bacterium]|nr:AraC family ligand binding domain-containing protein [Pseudomonadota bacterium]